MENNGIKLDLTDKKILFELDKNSRIPSTQLAKIVMKSRQAVEYRINNLVEKGIITGFKASINPNKIGNRIYKIYLKLKYTSQEKTQLLNYLRKSKKVYWIGECSGRWDLIFGIFAKTDYEFFEFKNAFISEFSELIIEEHGENLIDVKQYSKMYFVNTVSMPVEFGGKVVKNKLSETDLKILSTLSGNARKSVVEIAEESSSTPAIVISRMKKLEKLGIIIQYRIEVDTSKLELENYKIIINLNSYSKEDEKKFYQYVSRRPEMQYLIRNIWQLELEIVVKNFKKYYEFVEALKTKFPKMIKTIDFVLMMRDEWTTGFENLLNSSALIKHE